mmetsp:Transcript_1945/g.2582  ORF Transcript_1945/g.2582 Transcript_1945/m.2582 type:complete len:420 (+) Transcript_1945:107-1366(+)
MNVAVVQPKGTSLDGGTMGTMESGKLELDVDLDVAVDNDNLKQFQEDADKWTTSSKLYGNPGTNGGYLSNFIFNQMNRHPLIKPLTAGRIKHPGKSPNEVKSYQNFLILSFILSIGVGIFWFSSFGAIEFYKELDCECGCEEFDWPPTRTAILESDKYSEDYWDIGTKMCYPIIGQGITNSEKTQNNKHFPLGPAYLKPVPYQYCDDGVNCNFNGKDKLYTWSVNVDVINGVIFGKSDHHCEKDECYYVLKDVYDNHLCQPQLVMSNSEFWTMLIVSELLQTFMSSILLFLYKSDPEKLSAFIGGYCCICWCLCVAPVFFILCIAAMLNSTFATYLFLPFFTGKLFVWVFDFIMVPLLSIPTYFLHKKEFEAKFPNCFSVDDILMKQCKDTGKKPENVKALTMFAVVFMTIYDLLSKVA